MRNSSITELSISPLNQVRSPACSAELTLAVLPADPYALAEPRARTDGRGAAAEVCVEAVLVRADARRPARRQLEVHQYALCSSDRLLIYPSRRGRLASEVRMLGSQSVQICAVTAVSCRCPLRDLPSSRRTETSRSSTSSSSSTEQRLGSASRHRAPPSHIASLRIHGKARAEPTRLGSLRQSLADLFGFSRRSWFT